MKKQRIKRSLLTFLLVGIVLGVLGTIWYMRPVPQYTVTTLCSTDGEITPVIIDVTWYRSLLSPTRLEGTVTIGGKEYRNVSTASPENFLEQLRQKFLQEPTFYFASDGQLIKADWLYIFRAGEELDKNDSDYIHMCVSPRYGEITNYFGPAKTKDEADEIFSRFADGK